MTRFTERQLMWLLAGIGAGCFVLLLLLEIARRGASSRPYLACDAISILLTIGSAVGVVLLVQRAQAQHEEQVALLRHLEIARAEGEDWRGRVQSHLAGLKGAMEKQFHAWGSHKEIAALRATTDATVRQQAQSIYLKANLPGKTAFSAYFLEDLFVPDAIDTDPTAYRATADRTNGNGALSSEGSLPAK